MQNDPRPPWPGNRKRRTAVSMTLCMGTGRESSSSGQMMKKKQTRGLWKAVGVVIVATWVLLLGLLVRKIHFSAPPGGGSVTSEAPISFQDFQREWKELFLEDRKIGYAVHFIRPDAGGYVIQEEMFLRVNLMGMAGGVYTITQCRVDEQFRLRRFTFRMASGTVGFEARGEVKGDRLVVETGREGESSVQSLPVDEPPVMGAGLAYYFRNRPLHVGDSFQFPLFDPSTMSRKDIKVRVAGRETIRIRGIAYDTFRLEAEVWGDRLTFWLDENGATLKESGFMGLTAVRSSAAVAPENIEGSGDLDFYEIAAITPDRKISRPRDVSSLKVEMKGLERVTMDLSAWDSGRQKFSAPILEIVREELPLEAAFERPLKEGGDRFRDLLAPEFNMESEHEEIIRAAEDIAGSVTDPIEAAGLVQAWVYEHLEKRPVVSIPSALEVLRAGVGDCNEHATLATALLRALGIPARIVVGLVYTRGKFFYHAWSEAYVGEWLSMDPTLNQMPVDATHIKLLEGNLDRQVDLLGLIGRLELKVMDFEHD